MKLNEDQKMVLKSYLISSAGYIVALPLLKWLLGKEIGWDTVWNCLITVAVFGVFNLLIIIGAKVPKK